MEIRISIVSESAIASFWEEMSRSHYSAALERLEKSRDKYGLNDWGYAVQVHRFAESLYRNSAWNSKLMTWFLLTKSGISGILVRLRCLKRTYFLTFRNICCIFAKDKRSNMEKFMKNLGLVTMRRTPCLVYPCCEHPFFIGER